MSFINEASSRHIENIDTIAHDLTFVVHRVAAGGSSAALLVENGVPAL